MSKPIEHIEHYDLISDPGFSGVIINNKTNGVIGSKSHGNYSKLYENIKNNKGMDGDDVIYDSFVYDKNIIKLFTEEELLIFINKNIDKFTNYKDYNKNAHYYNDGIIHTVFINDTKYNILNDTINIINVTIKIINTEILHRTDGPALYSYSWDSVGRYVLSTKIYYVFDKKHRIDGPAVEFVGGRYVLSTKKYYVFDKKHRIDGPAVEFVGGSSSNEYYLDNKQLNKLTYKWKVMRNKFNKSNDEQLTKTLREKYKDVYEKHKDIYDKDLKVYKNKSNDEQLKELSTNVDEVLNGEEQIDLDKREIVLNDTLTKLNLINTYCEIFDYYLLNSIYDQTKNIYELFKEDVKLDIKYLKQLNLYFTNNLLELLKKTKTVIDTKEKTSTINIDRKELHKKHCVEEIDKVKIVDKTKINSYLYTIENQLSALYNMKDKTDKIDYRLKYSNLFLNIDYYVDPKNFKTNNNKLNYITDDVHIIKGWTITKKLLSKMKSNNFVFNYEYSTINTDLEYDSIICVCSLTDNVEFTINTNGYTMYISELDENLLEISDSTYLENIKSDLENTDSELKKLIYEKDNIKSLFFTKKLEKSLKDYINKLDEFKLNTEDNIEIDTQILDTIINTKMLNI